MEKHERAALQLDVHITRETVNVDLGGDVHVETGIHRWWIASGRAGHRFAEAQALARCREAERAAAVLASIGRR